MVRILLYGQMALAMYCILWIALHVADGAKQFSDSLEVPVKTASILQTQHQVAAGHDAINSCAAQDRLQASSCNDTEILCPGSFYSIFPWSYTCASASDGCPVSCASGEHVCTTPPLCELCAAVNYCSQQPCPVDACQG